MQQKDYECFINEDDDLNDDYFENFFIDKNYKPLRLIFCKNCNENSHEIYFN